MKNTPRMNNKGGINSDFSNLKVAESRAKETIRLNKRISPDYMQISIFYPYAGTKLHGVCKENDMLLDKHKDSYFDDGAMINSPTFSSHEINRCYNDLKHITFETYVRSHHPFAYFFYKISRKIIGVNYTEKILIFIKSKFAK